MIWVWFWNGYSNRSEQMKIPNMGLQSGQRWGRTRGRKQMDLVSKRIWGRCGKGGSRDGWRAFIAGRINTWNTKRVKIISVIARWFRGGAASTHNTWRDARVRWVKLTQGEWTGIQLKTFKSSMIGNAIKRLLRKLWGGSRFLLPSSNSWVIHTE